MIKKPKVFNYRKYREARETVIELTGEIVRLNLELLHLKEKATPKKVNVKPLLSMSKTANFCPSCGEMIFSETFRYCTKCGQRLLWENENGND